MPRLYQYVKINNYCFCLQQNPVLLAWILFFKRDDLLSIFTPWLKTQPPHGVSESFRYYYQLLKNAFITFLIFERYQLKLRNADQVVELPVYGQLCKQVHQGYKIFDLKRGKVLKIFDADVAELNIRDELDRLCGVAKIRFAPALGKNNIEEKWYEEEYISGSPLLSCTSIDSSNLTNAFTHEIFPSLIEIMLCAPPKLRKISAYLHEVTEVLEVSKLLKHKTGINVGSDSEEFINSIILRLENESGSDICLVFSHGDFCPANMLNSHGGLRILDWEGAAYRSVLFDFYSYFFYGTVCINKPVDMIVREINDALPILASTLATHSSEIREYLLPAVHKYRWIFYIEFICKLVARDMTDNNLNILDFILRYIKAFNRYEEILNIADASLTARSSSLN